MSLTIQFLVLDHIQDLINEFNLGDVINYRRLNFLKTNEM